MKIKLSKKSRLAQFTLLGMQLAVQAPIFGRPNFLHKYNDGQIGFWDFGPLRLYRYYWREMADL